jgi:hypothetical protein
MRRRFIAKSLGLVLLGVLVVALGVLASTHERREATIGVVAEPARPTMATAFLHRGLGGRTEQEIGQYAIDWVRAQGLAAPGSKTDFALVRPITRDEFETVGIPWVALPDPEPPLAVVILHGRFVVRGSLIDQSIQLPEAAYFLLVIDLEEGYPFLYMSSRRGGGFRDLLQDPSLPDDGPPLFPPLQPPSTSSSPLPVPNFADPGLREYIMAASASQHPPTPSTTRPFW